MSFDFSDSLIPLSTECVLSSKSLGAGANLRTAGFIVTLRTPISSDSVEEVKVGPSSSYKRILARNETNDPSDAPANSKATSEKTKVSLELAEATR